MLSKSIPARINFPIKRSFSILLFTILVKIFLFKLSNIVFAMDTIVLMQLNRFYKKYRNKFRLVSFQHRNINIVDPYNLPRKKYENVMENIKFVIDNLSIEEIN